MVKLQFNFQKFTNIFVKFHNNKKNMKEKNLYFKLNNYANTFFIYK